MDRSDGAHVLIAGGGVAALEAALALRALAEDRVSVELLAPEPHFWYRPLAVAEPFKLGEVRHFELSTLATEAGATFTPGVLVSVDAARRLAYISPGGAIPYSMLLVACGASRSRPLTGRSRSVGRPTRRRSSGCSRRSGRARSGASLSRCRRAPSGACPSTSWR